MGNLLDTKVIDIGNHPPCCQQENNFVKKYNELTDIVSKTIGIIMEAEISEALKLY